MGVASSILFISNVWPEPNSSAAGTHSLQLMAALKSFWAAFSGENSELIWASTARPSPHALPEAEAPCRYVSVAMNDEAADGQLRRINPAIVVFDRFMAEEQFGWRVRRQCPDAFRLLHTQDLHFLRRYRRKQPGNADKNALFTDTAMRELAAIYRCDLSLIISRYEMAFLRENAGIPGELLHFFPLAYDKPPSFNKPSFRERQDFVSIGNFLHAPNKDAVLRLKTTYWPEIRRRLPRALLHVYGAYCPAHIMQMSRPEEGFIVHGRARGLGDVLRRARVLLAPLRYGAGLKGKLLDAMRFGTPSVTTPVGCEGIAGAEAWPGAVVATDASAGVFAEHAARLHEEESEWEHASAAGRQLIATSFNKTQEADRLALKLREGLEKLAEQRARNLTGRLLWHHGQASTRYMSLWIEEKEKRGGTR